MNDINTPNELLSYMDNIIYGYKGNDGKYYTDDYSNFGSLCEVQTGEEVSKSKIGTCWDQVELEASWFESHNYEYETYFMWFEVGYECDLPTHTFLIYKENGKYYMFEHAFEAYRGIHEYNTLNEAIEDAMDKHIDYALKNRNLKEEEKDTLRIYKYDRIPNNLPINEYLDHVTHNR